MKTFRLPLRPIPSSPRDDGRSAARRAARTSAVVVAVVVAAVATAGCTRSDDSSDGSSGSSAAGGTTAPAAGLDETYDAAVKGTHTQPPTSGPAAVPDKNVWIVSCGEAAYSCSGPAADAAAAVSAIGWTPKVCDGKLDPSAQATCVTQAVAAGADGVIIPGIDCSGLVSALKAARAANIPVVGGESFDCDDPSVGGQPLFSAQIKFANDLGVGDYFVEQGRSRGAWVAHDSGGTAKVIDVVFQGSLAAVYPDNGFVSAVKDCSGCEIVDTVELAFSDLTTGTATQKITSSLLAHPEAQYINAPFDSAIPAWMLPAIADANRSDIKVVGSECFETNLDLIRSGKQANCSAIPSDWVGYAMVDAMNRLFAGEDAADIPNSGIGFQLVSKDLNLPNKGRYVPPVDFKSAYEKVWQG